MRKGILYAGVAVLVLGLVVFVIADLGAGQAYSALVGCLNGFPANPTYPMPPACSDAMRAIAMYGGLEIVGGILGLVGIVLLVIGLVLPPERPVPAVMPYYPPPVYGGPTGYTPPQGPQSPPPQP
ncbi:MAG TPA: hypothetical protein VEY12_03665 [Thermoplasmata archaeon]|nr:hypothetical protein [Thermoplasmata archaeon]